MRLAEQGYKRHYEDLLAIPIAGHQRPAAPVLRAWSADAFPDNLHGMLASFAQVIDLASTSVEHDPLVTDTMKIHLSHFRLYRCVSAQKETPRQ